MGGLSAATGRLVPGVGEALSPLTEAEFERLRNMIYREAGIALGPFKKDLLVARLRRRLRATGSKSFSSYYRLVRGDSAERQRMLDCISTNETRFFREPRQFEFLEQRLLPHWRTIRGRRSPGLRVWSAGCSTGEEPYSLAMLLLRVLPDWQNQILATDLSTEALSLARAALWPIEKSAEIPSSYLRQFMLRGTRSQNGWMKASPEIRSMVRFDQLNLHLDIAPNLGQFELIFCRNVLIYFDGPSRLRAVDRLLDHLAPGGVLFLGHAESLSELTGRVSSVGPNAYVRATDDTFDTWLAADRSSSKRVKRRLSVARGPS
ncbi:MAG: protein-glutamate O-methyltransferase CheR [Acidobacteriota bacterium]